MNILERALAAALKSVADDGKEILKTGQEKLDKFVKGVEETIEELDEISKDGKSKRKDK